MQCKHTYNWKLLYKVHNYVIFGFCTAIPCYKQYSKKISGFATGVNTSHNEQQVK